MRDLDINAIAVDHYGNAYLIDDTNKRLHQVLLDRLGAADEIDWSQAAADSAGVPANKGAMQPAQSDG